MANVLIVDDSIVMRKNLAAILTQSGHNIVGEASNGRQAVTQYEELKPDIVTMDISMPIMNGLMAVEEIIKKYPEAKIIVISAVNQKKMVYNAINLGAKHYIVKPIDAKRVLSVVNEVLSSIGEDNSAEEVEQLQEVQGFDIKNEEGEFIIRFNDKLDKSDHNLLNMAVRGILFIKPLVVKFDFDNIDDIDESILGPVIKLGKEIVSNGGEVRYRAVSETLMEKLPKSY